MTTITESPAWTALERHRAELDSISISDMFATDSDRFNRFSLELGELLFDYSKNRVTAETLALLADLAEAADVPGWRDRMFGGEPVNTTEDRPALHIALRNRAQRPIPADGADVMPLVRAGLEQMKSVSEGVRKGGWRAADRGPITHVIHLGVGGSEVGPSLVSSALAPSRPKVPHVFYVSNVDGHQLSGTLVGLDPARTLVIVASKSFRTAETLANTATVRDWLEQRLGPRAISRHMVAVTADVDAAESLGIEAENILKMWDWVGGRFSLWSAIGLTAAIDLGWDAFEQILIGAHAMDEHFRTAPAAKNMPMVAGLLGVWHRNFWGAASHAIVPYDQRLWRVPAYLQQISMESNGKSVGRDGEPAACATAPIVWGGPGTNAQHVFFQLLHQGTDLVPVDFLVSAEPSSELAGHHEMLIANCLAQSAALMRGRKDGTPDDPPEDGAKLDAHCRMPGNRPSNTIIYRRLTPAVLGMLLALYEHKAFVEATIWGINPFDQWGVELGKELSNELLPVVRGEAGGESWDGSTRGLLARMARWRKDERSAS